MKNQRNIFFITLLLSVLLCGTAWAGTIACGGEPPLSQRIGPGKRYDIVMLGDSRTVRLSSAIGAEGYRDESIRTENEVDFTLGADRFFGRETRGLPYLKAIWQNKARACLDGGEKCAVIWFGVNDPQNLAGYADQINRIAQEVKTFVVEVTPVGETCDRITNDNIRLFNSNLKGLLAEGITVIPMFDYVSQLPNVQYDDVGMHYDDDTSRLIWKQIDASIKEEYARSEEAAQSEAERPESGQSASE